MRVRRVSALLTATAVLLVAGLPAGACAAEVIRVGSGAARITLPASDHVAGLSWSLDHSTLSGPPRAAIVWTSSHRLGRRSWRWTTHVSWCTARHCLKATTVGSMRTHRRSDSPNTELGFSSTQSIDGARAFVRFGPRLAQRWALVERGAGVVRRGTDSPIAAAETPAYARRSDGTDWVLQVGDDGKLHLAQLNAGSLDGGPALSAGYVNEVELRARGAELSAAWVVGSDPDEEPGAVVWSSGSDGTQLASTANHVVLAAAGSQPLITGPGNGPQLISWRGAGVNGNAVTAMWASPTTAPDRARAITTTGPARPLWLQPVTTGLELCPVGLHSTEAGGALTISGRAQCAPTLFRVRVDGE